MKTTVVCPLPTMAAVIESTSPDAARAILTGVCLYTSNRSNMVLAAASTDSYRLTVAGVDVGNQSVETLMSKIDVDRNDAERRIILSGSCAKAILKAASRREHSQTTHVKLDIDGRSVTWALLIDPAALQGVYTVTEMDGRIEGEFPEIVSLCKVKGQGPTFLGNSSYAFNPMFLSGPADILKSLKRYVEVPPKRGPHTGTYVAMHGTGEGSTMKPAMFTMYSRLKDYGTKSPEASISVFYLLIPVRDDQGGVTAYPDRKVSSDGAPVIVDKWVADNRATYDYTVDTPLMPKRSAYGLDPEGDEAFATAWRKWTNHCAFVDECLTQKHEPCENDPKYGYYIKYLVPLMRDDDVEVAS